MTVLCVAKYENSKKIFIANNKIAVSLVEWKTVYFEETPVYVDIDTCSKELNDTCIARIFKNFHTYVFCRYADIVSAMCNCIFCN